MREYERYVYPNYCPGCGFEFRLFEHNNDEVPLLAKLCPLCGKPVICGECGKPCYECECDDENLTTEE